ncbi:MAG: hypothetical protein M1282_18220 [Chloroflexi bacterium]|nr:hypothetical protein [Chloroflexota bacterium]
MAKGKEENSNGRSPFWAGYGRQVLIAPALAFALLAVFSYFFGFDASLLWTNAIVLAIWFVLVLFAFRSRAKGGVWRDYRWIIVPAVLILLFLFDTSWAQSALSTSSLKKNIVGETSLGSLQLHAEYPSQILYDDINESNIRLWVTGSSESAQQTTVEVSSTGQALLFAIKPQSDNVPVEWRGALTLELAEGTNAMTLLVQPISPPDVNSQLTNLILSVGSKNLDTSKWSQINVESKLASQIRTWKKNFLDAGSLVVSLITAVFVGVKQLEEERKRQRADQIKQIIETFDADAKNDLSKTLQEHLDLTADWNDWDKALQEQFRKAYASFVDEKLWDALVAKTIAEITGAVDLLLRVCKRVFRSEQEKPTATLEKLQSALRQDKQAHENLLSVLKEYHASINTAKIIASAFPLDLKKKTIAEYTGKFPGQIRALRVELGFTETESFPLQTQFAFYAKEHIPADKLIAWLTAHDLNYSPFTDADSPFYSVFDEQLVIDWAGPSFALSVLNLRNITFEFTNSWDAGAALFEYCKALQPNVRLKDDAFFAILTPGMVEKYGSEHSRKLLLHTLAEQWTWLLAEIPTLFYSLKSEQRDLAGRLLRWHDFSPSIIVNKIAEFARYLQESKKEGEKEEEKNQTVFFSKMMEWLTNTSADDLRIEEINALIGLRPSPKQRTLFLISTIDLNPRIEKQILSKLHGQLDEQSDWLSAHDCELVRFQIGNKHQQMVSESSLVNQCNIRVQKCSKEGNIVFNQLFDAPGVEPSAILACKANGSPGKMVRLGQKLLLQHVEKYPPDEDLHIEDLRAIK